MSKKNNVFLSKNKWGIKVEDNFFIMLFSNYLVWVFIAIILIIILFTARDLFTPINISIIILNSTIMGIMVLATSLPLLVGKVDLSVESTMGFCAMIGAILAKNLEYNSYVSIIIMLAIGACIGLFNGLCVVKLGVNFFMQGLAVLLILRGFMLMVLGGQGLIEDLPENYKIFGGTKLFGIPTPIIIFILLVVLFYFVTEKRTFGRQLTAIGMNKEAAAISGINVDRLTIFSYVIAGLLAAFAGLIQTTRFVRVDSSVGEGMFFFVVAAAIIGGFSLFGGKGNVIGALGGIIFLGLVFAIVTWYQLEPTAVDFIRGGLILFAVVLDAFKNKIISFIK